MTRTLNLVGTLNIDVPTTKPIRINSQFGEDGQYSVIRNWVSSNIIKANLSLIGPQYAYDVCEDIAGVPFSISVPQRFDQLEVTPLSVEIEHCENDTAHNPKYAIRVDYNGFHIYI